MKKNMLLLAGCSLACSLQAIVNLDRDFNNNVQWNKFEEAKELLTKGADINNRKFDLGNTVLHTVAKNNDVKAVKFLIAQGAKVNLGNKDTIQRGKDIPISTPYTPLHLAVLSNSLDSARLLLNAGARVNDKAIIRGVFGQKKKSPLSMARSLKMKKLLKEHGGKKFSKQYKP